MNLGPSNPNHQPGMSGQHDAPTEMFQANPAPPNAPYQQGAGAPFNRGQRTTPSVRPEQLINKKKGQTLPPGPLHTKIAYLWRSDPAYKVLFIAIGAVILCSIIGIILLGNAFASFGKPATNPNQNGIQSTANGPQNTPTSVATQPTVTPTTQPTATPTLEPTATPITQPTVAPTPTPAPNNGPLTAQFTNVPAQAANHSTVFITVTTKPGATVGLFITYNASPAFQQTNTVVADANGTATIPWTINEKSFSRFTPTITARLTAAARDQNGQQATSQPATVQITG